jgi:hypothetical protein
LLLIAQPIRATLAAIDRHDYEMDVVRKIRNKVAGEGAGVSRLDADDSVKTFVAALANVFGSKVEAREI